MNHPRRHFASRLLQITAAVGLAATLGFGASAVAWVMLVYGVSVAAGNL